MVEDYFLDWPIRTYEANENDPTGSSKKRVIVFHCEFSSERAPVILRFLRKMDRAKNRYPALDLPELYLLKDGYKVIISIYYPKISPFLSQNWLLFSFSHLNPICAYIETVSFEPKMSLFWDFFVWSPKLDYFENFLFELKIGLCWDIFILT